MVGDERHRPFRSAPPARRRPGGAISSRSRRTSSGRSTGRVVELPVDVALAGDVEGTRRRSPSARRASARSASSRWGCGRPEVDSESCIASTTSGWTWAAGLVSCPRAASLTREPFGERAAAICERPAFWTQLNSTFDLGSSSRFRVSVGEKRSTSNGLASTDGETSRATRKLDAPAGFSTCRPLIEPVDERAFDDRFRRAGSHLASPDSAERNRLKRKASAARSRPAGATHTLTVAGSLAAAGRTSRASRRRAAGTATRPHRDSPDEEGSLQCARTVTRGGKNCGSGTRSLSWRAASRAQAQSAGCPWRSPTIVWAAASQRLLRPARRGQAESAPPAVLGEGSSPLEQTRGVLAAQLREILQHDPGTRQRRSRYGCVSRPGVRGPYSGRSSASSKRVGDSLRAELGWQLGSSLRRSEISMYSSPLPARRRRDSVTGRNLRRSGSSTVSRPSGSAGRAAGGHSGGRYAALLDRLEQARSLLSARRVAVALPALAAAEFESCGVASKLDASLCDGRGTSSLTRQGEEPGTRLPSWPSHSPAAQRLGFIDRIKSQRKLPRLNSAAQQAARLQPYIRISIRQ